MPCALCARSAVCPSWRSRGCCKPHYNYIGGIERGERHPTVQALASIAIALELEPIEIYRRADEILRDGAGES